MTVPFALDRPDFVYLAVRHAVESLHPDLDADQIFSPTGRRTCYRAAMARLMAMYVMAERLGLSHSETALQCRRDRSSVTSAVSRVASMLDEETIAETVARVERLTRSLLALFSHVEAESRSAAPPLQPPGYAHA